jgi:addiction module HigA family antidote
MKIPAPKNRMRPIHPGEILREEFIEPLGLSASSLAVALRTPAPRINDIVREKRSISVDTALRLARYFGTTPQFWMNLQTAFDLKVGQNRLMEKISREVIPRETAESEA